MQLLMRKNTQIQSYTFTFLCSPDHLAYCEGCILTFSHLDLVTRSHESWLKKAHVDSGQKASGKWRLDAVGQYSRPHLWGLNSATSPAMPVRFH